MVQSIPAFFWTKLKARLGKTAQVLGGPITIELLATSVVVGMINHIRPQDKLLPTRKGCAASRSIKAALVLYCP